MQTSRLDESQTGINTARRNISNLRYADGTTLMAGSEEEELKSPDEDEREEGKGWLRTQHSKNEDYGLQSHHFIANRCGETMETDRLFSWALKSLQMLTAAMKLKDTCSLEEKL